MTPDDAGVAFIAGKIDAAVTWEPHLSLGLSEREGSVLLASSADYPKAILDLFICRREWFQENPNKVSSFRESWDEALKFIEEHPTEAHVIIGEEIGIDPIEVGLMLKGAKLLTSREGMDLLSSDLDSLSRRVTEIWTKAGYVEGDIDLKASIQLNSE